MTTTSPPSHFTCPCNFQSDRGGVHAVRGGLRGATSGVQRVMASRVTGEQGKGEKKDTTGSREKHRQAG